MGYINIGIHKLLRTCHIIIYYPFNNNKKNIALVIEHDSLCLKKREITKNILTSVCLHDILRWNLDTSINII